ncbi:MAG TPA: hypothetical protein VGH38_21450 [Bryobacteraceae bacterium]
MSPYASVSTHAFRAWLLLLAGATPLASQIAGTQIAVTPLRIAGLSAAAWPIGDGGPATEALLSPSVLTWDRNGNLLIADTRNHRIRRLTPDGVISTLFNQDGVSGMAVDSQGNLYVSVYPTSYDKPGQIFRFSPAGVKAEIPNPGSPGFAPAIAIDRADGLYITDQLPQGGGLVWKRSSLGPVVQVTTVASGLSGPRGLAFDSSSNLLIADSDGILRLNPDGTLVRLMNDAWSRPRRIAAAADGSIYFIGDYYGIWRWSPAGGITSFAGTSQSGFSDGCASAAGRRVAKYASLNPSDLVFDPAGRLYVADNATGLSGAESFYYYNAGRVRRIDPDGSIRTVAGAGVMPHESAPGGPALGSIFHNPEALAVDARGNVFFAESSANHIHQITAAGQFLTVAGADSPPAGEDPACYPPGKDVLSSPGGLGTDPDGNLYISDTGNHRILRRSVNGAITTIAGTGTEGQTGDGGPAVEARISRPTAIAVKPDGSIYFLSDGQVRRIGTDGIIDSPQAPQGLAWLAVGFDGRLILSGVKLYQEAAGGLLYALRSGVGKFAADLAGAIYSPAYPLLRISPNCNVSQLVSPALTSQFLQGLAVDPAGNLLLSADNSVWRIAAVKPPATDTPSIYLDNPGVFNAASNLAAYTTVPPPCFKQCGPYAQNDAIAANEILRITGGCMGPLEPWKSPVDDGRLPVILQGTQVLFDGKAAPLLSVQATEILAVVPHNVASTSNVTVSNQSVKASVVLNVVPASPGVFVSSGAQAAAINEDGSLNSAAHPAPVGSVVALFVTGAGLTDPPIDDSVPPALPLPLVALPVTVKVGGAPADVAYAGSVLGLVGLAQLNIRIPAVAPSNAVPVQVTIGGISRNQAVTIAIQ